MSPSVGNFVHDLVEMAKAMEELPQVKAQVDHLLKANETQLETIQRLELRLIDRSNEIETLNSKVREAEQGRDAAETMFLETDDKLSAFRSLVNSFASDATSLMQAQEPVVEAKPEPVYPNWGETSMIGVLGEPAPGYSEANPTPAPTAEPSVGPSDADLDHAVLPAATSTGQADEGVSVSQDPTTPAHTGEISAFVHSSVIPDATMPEPVSVPTPPTSAPVDQTGTGTEPVASSSEPDLEPTARWSSEWYDWRDRQHSKKWG